MNIAQAKMRNLELMKVIRYGFIKNRFNLSPNRKITDYDIQQIFNSAFNQMYGKKLAESEYIEYLSLQMGISQQMTKAILYRTVSEISEQMMNENYKLKSVIPAERVLKNNSNFLRDVAVQTEDLCKQAIRKSYRALRHVKNPTKEIYEFAVHCNPKAVQYVKSSILTAKEYEKICMIAAKQDGDTIRFMRSPTKKVQMASLKSTFGESIRHIKNPMPEIRELAMSMKNDEKASMNVDNSANPAMGM